MKTEDRLKFSKEYKVNFLQADFYNNTSVDIAKIRLLDRVPSQNEKLFTQQRKG